MDNRYLKIIFIISSIALLIALVLSPKTDCGACSIEYNGKQIDGYQAFEIFEDACISYDKPWEMTVEEELINATIIGDGSYVINFTETPL